MIYRGIQWREWQDIIKRLKGNIFSVGSGSTFAYGILDS